MLQQFGIPKDAAAAFALQALMGEGLGLDAQTIKAVRTIALRHAQPRRAAALAARAIAAGLKPDDESMNALIRTLAGLPVDDVAGDSVRVQDRQSGNGEGNESGNESGSKSGNEDGNDPGKDNDREPGRDSSQEQGRDPGKDTRMAPPEESDAPHPADSSGSDSGDSDSGRLLQSGPGARFQAGKPTKVSHECQDEVELRKNLESAFMGFSSRAASDPGFSSLARRGPDGRGWLCVPYQFSVDDVDFSGYFRIVFNYASNKVERLVAEIDSSGQTRFFDVSWGPKGKPQLRFMPGSAVEGKDFLRTFGKSMKVELIPQVEDPALIDTVYREVDGHA
jgi:hypothetical protein